MNMSFFTKAEHGKAYEALKEAAKLLKYEGYAKVQSLIAEKGATEAANALAETCKTAYGKVRTAAQFIQKIESLAEEIGKEA